MFRYFVWFALSLQLSTFDPILSSFFCTEPTIDSIAFASDLRMFFISSGEHFWWIKEGSFPPKESEAKKLPSPFTKATAAVYINSQGCASPRAGVRPNESEIWITDVIDGKHHLMSFDTRYDRWSEPIVIDKDHCISKAKVDLSTNSPIDAMFSRNNLDIFVVMGNTYAMVDCNFLCHNPKDGFADNYSPQNTASDWKIGGSKSGSIHGTYISVGDTKEEKLMVFKRTTYLWIQIKDIEKGKFVAQNKGIEKTIFTDFLKLDKNKCKSTQTIENKDQKSSDKSSGDLEDKDYIVDYLSPNKTDDKIKDKTENKSEDKNEDETEDKTEGNAENQQNQESLPPKASNSDENGDEVGGGAILVLIVLFIAILLVLGIGIFMIIWVQKTSPKDSVSTVNSKVEPEMSSKVTSPLSPTTRSPKLHTTSRSELAKNKAKSQKTHKK